MTLKDRILNEKQSIRKFFRDNNQLYKIDSANLEKLIERIKIFLSLQDSIENIGIFYPIANEPLLWDFFWSLRTQYGLCMPNIINQEIKYFKIDSPDKIILNEKLSVFELNNIYCNSSMIPELIFIPGVSFDSNLNRLGYGGGYFDRFLTNIRKNYPNIIATGVTFDDQMLDFLPCNEYDQKLNCIITETKLIT